MCVGGGWRGGGGGGGGGGGSEARGESLASGSKAPQVFN